MPDETRLHPHAERALFTALGVVITLAVGGLYAAFKPHPVVAPLAASSGASTSSMPASVPTDPSATDPSAEDPVSPPPVGGRGPRAVAGMPQPLAELMASPNPADWARARALLEPKVFSGRGTPLEVRMLRSICKNQQDRDCLGRLNAGGPGSAAALAEQDPSDPAAADRGPAAADAFGYLTVICLPGCDQIDIDGQPVGASPLFKKRLTVGDHTVTLTSSNPPVTKEVHKTVVSDTVVMVRQSMS